MSVAVLKNAAFPVGQSVGAYPRSAWRPGAPPEGAPSGAALETQTVASDGTLSFGSGADDTTYYAYASVGGAHRIVAFRPKATTSTSTLANLIAQPTMVKLAAGKGATILVEGDSTSDAAGEWPDLMARWLASLFPRLRVEFTTWGDGGSVYPATTVIQAGDGTFGTLFVYNCSVGGKTTQYFLAPYFDAMVAGPQPDLIFINLGHNHTTAAAEPFWRDDLLALLEPTMRANPKAEVVLLTQNPRTDSSAVQQADRRNTTMSVAGTLGLGVIDAYRFFLNADGSVNTNLLIDSLHPNAIGEQLIWAEIMAHMAPVAGVGPRTQDDSSLIIPVVNALLNGDFATFAVPPTLTNWPATQCVPSKDVTNFEGPNGYGVLLTSSAAAVSHIEQGITGNALKQFLGEWVVLAARAYIPAGQNSNVGRVHLRTTGAASNPSQNSTASVQGQGGFRWVTTSIRVPKDAGTLTARLYCENGTTNTGLVTYDRVILAKGIRPRDIR